MNIKLIASTPYCFYLNVSEEAGHIHCVKSVRIWSYSGPYFPAFGLTTERYNTELLSLFSQNAGK